MEHEGVEGDTVPVHTYLETQITISLTIPRNSFFKHKRNVNLMDTTALIYNYESLFSLYFILDWLYIDNIIGLFLVHSLLVNLDASTANKHKRRESTERGLP